MKLINKIKNHYREKERKKALLNIRASLAFFGYDVSELTDQQIEDSVIAFSKAAAQCGVSVEEAAAAFKMLSDIM